MFVNFQNLQKLEEMIDNVEWDVIVRYQKLSEFFIEKCKDELDWDL